MFGLVSFLGYSKEMFVYVNPCRTKNLSAADELAGLEELESRETMSERRDYKNSMAVE